MQAVKKSLLDLPSTYSTQIETKKRISQLMLPCLGELGSLSQEN